MHSQQPPTYNNSEPRNDESEAQQLLPQEHEILRRFMAVIVSSAFRNSLIMGIAQKIARYVAKWGIAPFWACVKLSTRGGIAPFWGSANLL